MPRQRLELSRITLAFAGQGAGMIVLVSKTVWQGNLPTMASRKHLQIHNDLGQSNEDVGR